MDVVVIQVLMEAETHFIHRCDSYLAVFRNPGRARIAGNFIL
jgi:hypothetical protein